MKGEPLPFWFGVIVGMVGPLAFVILGVVVGRVCMRVGDWAERKVVAHRIAAECARAPERVR